RLRIRGEETQGRGEGRRQGRRQVGTDEEEAHNQGLTGLTQAKGLAVTGKAFSFAARIDYLPSSRLRSIQAVFSCTCMRCVSRSALGSSSAASTSGSRPRAVLITAS